MNSNGIKHETIGAGFKELQKGNGQQKAKKQMRKRVERPKPAVVSARNWDYLLEKFS